MAKEAAAVMKLTAGDLQKQGIVEQVIAEPTHFTVANLKKVTEPLSEQIHIFLDKYRSMAPEELVEQRYERFRRM